MGFFVVSSYYKLLCVDGNIVLAGDQLAVVVQKIISLW